MKKKSDSILDTKLREISPLGYRVLVQIEKLPDQTRGGLYLPDGAKEREQQSLLASVKEVASALDEETEEEENISGIPQGALVLIPSTAGVKVPWDDTLRIVDSQDVLAMVEEAEMI